jgi:Flp pilus assembly protein TadG
MSPLVLARSRPLAKRLRRWRRDARGVAAVEFALFAPIIGVILAGAVDFGGVVFVKFGIENAVSAGANYAIVNAAKVNSTNGPTLANNISAIVASAGSGGNSVVVNNGPTATYASDNTITPSGTASNANSCYCPTISSSTVTWGAAATCGSSCAGGGIAGKFVRITANRNYTPFFFNYGIVTGGSITVRVMVQVQ